MGSPTIAGFPALARASGAGGAALGEGALSLRVVVRTPTVETFVQRYSRFVKDDRIFIFTKTSQPPGTRLRFTLELVDGRPLVAGEGTVTRVRADSGDPNRPPGMELSFVPTDEHSRKIVQLMLDERLARGPKTGSLSAPPIPPSPQLPSLPQTGAFSTIDAKAVVQQAASPLLRGQVAGQATDLPARPGTLRTQEKESPRPSASDHRAVALANTLHAAAAPAPAQASDVAAVDAEQPKTKSEKQRPAIPAIRPAGAAPAPSNVAAHETTEPTVVAPDSSPTDLPVERTQLAYVPVAQRTEEESGVVIDVPVEPVAAPQAPAMLRPPGVQQGATAPPVTTAAPRSDSASNLDAESLFNLGEVGSAPAAGGTPLPATLPLPSRADDPSFPELEAAPAFAEGWRAPSASDGSTVPANPFSEISDNAIEYFVEWSLERSTGSPEEAEKKTSASFGAVPMKAPTVESPHRGASFGLAVGLAIGALAGGVVAWLAKPSGPAHETRPAAVATTKSTETVTSPPEKAADAPAATAPHAPAVAAAAAKPASGAKGQEVAILSKPAGAAVTVDGKPLGRTPLSLPLPAGAHTVRLSLDRYVDYDATVVAPGQLDAKLVRPRATLKVTSTPTGAEVRVSGESRGKTPAQVALPQYESYSVEVSLNGKSWKRRVYVNKVATTVQATLTSGKPAAARPVQAQGRTVELPGQRSTGFR